MAYDEITGGVAGAYGRYVGRMSLEDARKANSVSPAAEIFFLIFSVTAMTLIMSVAVYEALNELKSGFLRNTWPSRVEVTVAVIVIGGVAFWIRDIKQFIFYPGLEIAAGITLATQAIQPNAPDVVIVLLTTVGGVRLIVDGIKRWRDFRLLRRRADPQSDMDAALELMARAQQAGRP